LRRATSTVRGSTDTLVEQLGAFAPETSRIAMFSAQLGR